VKGATRRWWVAVCGGLAIGAGRCRVADGRMYLDRQPAAGRLGDFLVFEIEEAWDAGSCEVDVEDAHVVALVGQREGELNGDGGFAHPTFAGKDEDNVLYILQAHCCVLMEPSVKV
jgi:hypothetical protein